jgi:hypothetical protein
MQTEVVPEVEVVVEEAGSVAMPTEPVALPVGSAAAARLDPAESEPLVLVVVCFFFVRLSQLLRCPVVFVGQWLLATVSSSSQLNRIFAQNVSTVNLIRTYVSNVLGTQISR